MAFKRIYKETKTMIGFGKTSDAWLLACIEDGGIYIGKAYLSSEPALSVKQARKFANKILGFCDRIEKQRK